MIYLTLRSGDDGGGSHCVGHGGCDRVFEEEEGIMDTKCVVLQCSVVFCIFITEMVYCCGGSAR